ncbi:ABC transporter substrate-binding protein [Ramlibacter albus]|uniref:ABC transporter substrate-binding protein n=1 Tax=Ramlibacter albus TaxID=2079448 RepID=A0A923S4I4_9BURK|nr:ABC transporter substrate-binding protein [Ramlibacter albus]MBC5764167.1 ABC transporter substrate-binding protein [Ramlibacter albus]
MDRRRFTLDALALAGGAAVGAAARAQGVRRIGVLSPAVTSQMLQSFRDGLSDLGYVEGRTLVVEVASAEGRIDKLPALAEGLVKSRVEVIVVAGPIPLQAARNATSSIPIVMMASSSDPLGEGVVRTLARPGGNVTGLTYAVSTERFAKQLEVLKEAAPATKRVAVCMDIGVDAYRKSWQAPLEAAIPRLGMQLLEPVRLSASSDMAGAFAAMRQQRVDAVMVAIGGLINTFARELAAAAVQHKLPTIAAQKSFTRAGGLVSYGPDIPAIYRRAATYVDRILKGTPAAELPVELPTKYELALNTKTAAALGLALPQSLVLRADEVYQ